MLIRSLVIAAYLGWIAYSASFVLVPAHEARTTASSSLITALSAALLLVFWALFAIQHSPRTFYVYIVFPCFFWRQALVAFIHYWRSRKQKQVLVRMGDLAKYVGFSTAAVAALQCMVVSIVSSA